VCATPVQHALATARGHRARGSACQTAPDNSGREAFFTRLGRRGPGGCPCDRRPRGQLRCLMTVRIGCRRGLRWAPHPWPEPVTPQKTRRESRETQPCQYSPSLRVTATTALLLPHPARSDPQAASPERGRAAVKTPACSTDRSIPEAAQLTLAADATRAPRRERAAPAFAGLRALADESCSQRLS